MSFSLFCPTFLDPWRWEIICVNFLPFFQVSVIFKRCNKNFWSLQCLCTVTLSTRNIPSTEHLTYHHNKKTIIWTTYMYILINMNSLHVTINHFYNKKSEPTNMREMNYWKIVERSSTWWLVWSCAQVWKLSNNVSWFHP